MVEAEQTQMVEEVGATQTRKRRPRQDPRAVAEDWAVAVGWAFLGREVLGLAWDLEVSRSLAQMLVACHCLGVSCIKALAV